MDYYVGQRKISREQDCRYDKRLRRHATIYLSYEEDELAVLSLSSLGDLGRLGTSSPALESAGVSSTNATLIPNCRAVEYVGSID